MEVTRLTTGATPIEDRTSAAEEEEGFVLIINCRPGENDEMAKLAAKVVVAYVGSHTVKMGHLPDLIAIVCDALALASQPLVAEEIRISMPAVPKEKSVELEYIVCLECGLKLRSMRRHLAARHKTVPSDYRNKWGLAADYPMAAPSFAQTRSRQAKEKGFGRSHRKR